MIESDGLHVQVNGGEIQLTFLFHSSQSKISCSFTIRHFMGSCFLEFLRKWIQKLQHVAHILSVEMNPITPLGNHTSQTVNSDPSR